MPIGMPELIIIVISAALLLAALYVFVRGLARILGGPNRTLEADLGVDALRHRLKRGEITQAEFEEGKRLLGRG